MKHNQMGFRARFQLFAFCFSVSFALVGNTLLGDTGTFQDDKSKIAEEVAVAVRNATRDLEGSKINSWTQAKVENGRIVPSGIGLPQEVEESFRRGHASVLEYLESSKIEDGTPVIALRGPSWYAIAFLRPLNNNPDAWTYSSVAVFSAHAHDFLLTLFPPP